MPEITLTLTDSSVPRAVRAMNDLVTRGCEASWLRGESECTVIASYPLVDSVSEDDADAIVGDLMSGIDIDAYEWEGDYVSDCLDGGDLPDD